MLVTFEFHEGPSVRSTLAIHKRGEKYKTKAMQKRTWTQKKLYNNMTRRRYDNTKTGSGQTETNEKLDENETRQTRAETKIDEHRM